MRPSFEGSLPGKVAAILTSNGVNLTGRELSATASGVADLLDKELELVVTDPKELSAVQADYRAKVAAKEKTEKAEKSTAPATVPEKPSETTVPTTWQRKRWT